VKVVIALRLFNPSIRNFCRDARRVKRPRGAGDPGEGGNAGKIVRPGGRDALDPRLHGIARPVGQVEASRALSDWQ
jgi:hypothetical protein